MMTHEKKNENSRRTVPSLGLYGFVCKILHGMIVFAWLYCISIFCMVYLIPTSTAYLANGMGITYDSKMIDVIGLWLLPSGFLVLLLVCLTITSIKWINRWLKQIFDKSIQKHYLQKQTKALERKKGKI